MQDNIPPDPPRPVPSPGPNSGPADELLRRTHVQYLGRVQGVGFRATARDAATLFPVTGWVRNEPDGSVTLEAQGPAHDLERFLHEIRRRLGRNIETEVPQPRPLAFGERAFIIAR